MTELQKNRIYTDYKNKVYSYNLSKINNVETAEDLTSDVFVKVFGKIDTFDETKASFSTWIYQIAKNIVVLHFTQEKP